MSYSAKLEQMETARVSLEALAERATAASEALARTIEAVKAEQECSQSLAELSSLIGQTTAELAKLRAQEPPDLSQSPNGHASNSPPSGPPTSAGTPPASAEEPPAPAEKPKRRRKAKPAGAQAEQEPPPEPAAPPAENPPAPQVDPDVDPEWAANELVQMGLAEDIVIHLRSKGITSWSELHDWLEVRTLDQIGLRPTLAAGLETFVRRHAPWELSAKNAEPEQAGTDEWSSIAVNTLNFSQRAITSLEHMGLKTMGQLMEWLGRGSALSSVKGIGEKLIPEAVEVIEAFCSSWELSSPFLSEDDGAEDAVYESEEDFESEQSG